MEILKPGQRAGLILALLLAFAAAAVAGTGLPHWLTVVSADQLKGDVSFLASEELGGRAVLSPGSRTAAAFIASRFAAMGLRPAGEGDRDWFQEVPITRTPVRSGICKVSWRRLGPPALELAWGRDFRCRPVEAKGFDVSAKAVFAGYGISASDRGHDDYAGLDVKGRILLVLDGGPEGEWGRSHTSVNAKRSEALEREAEALIILPRPGAPSTRPHPWPDHLAPPGDEAAESNCPLILLTEDAGRRLAELAGIIDDPTPRALVGVRVACSLEIGKPETVTTRNVLGLIPGGDDLLFREFIIVSAHYDHLGRRGDGLFYPGADDNASGVAALLGAARALATLQPHQRPARTIVFAAWAGEERGLLGSEHFGEDPTIPRGQIKGVLNLDMVGRGGGMARATYSAQAPDLESLLDGAAATAGLDLRLHPCLEMPLTSDHLVFHGRGIPAIHLFSGFHSDYNRPGDQPQKLEYPNLHLVTQTAAELAFQLADTPEIPAFDETITEVGGRTDPF